MSLILHAADISHPAKTWKLHYRWTMALMEEFFLQVPSLSGLETATVNIDDVILFFFNRTQHF